MATKTQPPKKTTKKIWVDLGARGTPEENKTINKAAEIARQSRCQFVLQASLERAAIYLAAQTKEK